MQAADESAKTYAAEKGNGKVDRELWNRAEGKIKPPEKQVLGAGHYDDDDQEDEDSENQ